MPRKHETQSEKRVEKIARKVVKKELKKEVEEKFLDNIFINQGVTSGAGTYTFNLTNNIAQGATAQDRIGDRIMLKYIDLTLQAKSPYFTLSVFGEAVRCIIYRYNDDDSGATPDADFVLQYGTSVTNFEGVNSPYLWESIKGKRISILYDSGPRGSKFYPEGNTERMRKRIKVNRPIQYDAGLGTGSGNIYFLVVGSTANSWVFDGNARVVYTDM